MVNGSILELIRAGRALPTDLTSLELYPLPVAWRYRSDMLPHEELRWLQETQQVLRASTQLVECIRLCQCRHPELLESLIGCTLIGSSIDKTVVCLWDDEENCWPAAKQVTTIKNVGDPVAFVGYNFVG